MSERVPNATRLPTLDGLRGMLALIVVADHAVELCVNSYALAGVATECVAVFFAMSAMVLARSYDGRYGRFLARRAVRLLPVYLLCWAAGCAVYGRVGPACHHAQSRYNSVVSRPATLLLSR